MRKMVGSVAVLVGMLLLSGCGSSDPLPTLPPTPSSTPVFASEEEALAAAEDAYAAYLGVSDLIASEGGINPERIAPFVTERRLADEMRGFATLREHDLRISGSSAFETLELQRYDERDGQVEIVFYVCSDISASRVIDETGSDVTPADRVDRSVLEVVIQSGDEGQLLLESDEMWPGDGC